MLRRPLFRLFDQKNRLSVSYRTVYRSALDNPDKIAVIDSNGRYSYSNLLSASVQLRDKLVSATDDKQKSVGFHVQYVFHFVKIIRNHYLIIILMMRNVLI
jgi:non-ribosomal peptide synthetase component E (peptide arylation enzyme)